MSIGQGYTLVTPLEMAQVYAILANKGKVYTPHVLQKKITDDGVEKYKTSVKILTNYPKSYYNILTDDLIATVESSRGTAKKVRKKGLKVAAKTGSAQNSHYEKTHAWVAGYFPANDPEIVFVSFIEGGGAGGSVAGPSVKYFY